MKETCRDEKQEVPRRMSRMKKGEAASMLGFVNSVFWEVKYERRELQEIWSIFLRKGLIF